MSLLILSAACADQLEGTGEEDAPIGGDDAGPAAGDGGSWDGSIPQDGSTPPPTPQDSGTPTPDSGTPVDAAMPPAPPTGSSGCNAASWPMNGMQSIDVDGTARTYIVKAPAAYDGKKPMKLVFAWHGLGGTAEQIATGYGFPQAAFYGLETRAMGTTIFVAGQGLEAGGGAGWPNTGGRDVAFVRKMLDWLKTNYCIDEGRIFSAGMSYGGIMSNTIGCQLGDVFRAIAPIAGMGPAQFGGAQCTGQVAAWIAHGNTDAVVQFSAGQASRDYWVGANHCQKTTTMVGPDKCVAYEGCDMGHPVHWCEFDGGHTVPMFSAEAIWTFFSQF